MDKIKRLTFDDDFLIESAESRLEEGDYLGALTILNKREGMHAPLADAYAVYADVYEALELWQLCADSWFRFLDTCNEADFPEGYEGLAIAFMNLGNDLQSSFYYHLAYAEDEELPFEIEEEPPRPRLRLVHAEGMKPDASEQLGEGLFCLKSGDLEGARKIFSEVDEESADYASAMGLSAMCTLMLGDESGAEEVCKDLVQKFPDNVQVLTTYCAVLGALENTEGAKEIAARLARLSVDGTDDLYRVATALCETGLHQEAYEKLSILKNRLPYDENVLWFYAVAAYRTERDDEAISALELLTTVFPRKAVAAWYLAEMRRRKDDGGERVPVNYYYRMPESLYREIAKYFLDVSGMDGQQLKDAASSEEFAECFRLAFDEMEGRDEKFMLLAAKSAVRGEADALIRSVLLDREGDELVKVAILHDLICRNRDDSFGVVVCNLYKEVFLHRLELGRKKRNAFLHAFADVYAKFGIAEENGVKLCVAGESVYDYLSAAEEWSLFDDRPALASAIYREARIPDGERSLEEICKLFGADPEKTKKILDCLM